MTQVELARTLAISPSYLNQIEHDHRPLTASVLLRLTELFGVEPSYFSPSDTARVVAGLREALTVVENRRPVPVGDLHEIARTMPELSEAILGLYESLRERGEALDSLTDARSTAVTTATAHEQVRDFFYRRNNYVDVLDRAAEDLSRQMGTRRGEVRNRLKEYLLEKHDIRVVTDNRPVRGSDDDGTLHWYDQEERVLHFSANLRGAQYAFRMATQLALIECSDLIERVLDEEIWGHPSTRALARVGLANHFAGAFILPYGPFIAAAEQMRYDVELLADHFGVSYETAAHRLSTLRRPGLLGVPFIFVRVDRAGNISKRQSATSFHFSRGGGTCPLWNVYEAFSAPGRVMTQVAEMPDGQRYLWVARSVTTNRGGYGRPAKTFAIGLGCEVRHAGRLVYGDGLDVHGPSAAMPIGPGCKTCEREKCPQRAAPMVGRPLVVDEHRSAFSPYSS